MVAFLIDGLVNWQHVSAITENRPANVTEFIQWIRILEALGVAPRVFPPPVAPPLAPPAASPSTTTIPPVPVLNTTLAVFGNQLVNQLTAQFNKLAIESRGAGRGGGGGYRGGVGGGERGGGGWADLSKRKFYSCGVVGHISRYCSTKSGKDTAGR
jgi:hypothetical protein